jgi:hypothetical protein
MDVKFYLFKITLLDVTNEIWRRFAVPSDIPLDRLHDIIQIIMGWGDSHLHEFTISKERYTEYPESDEDGLPCGKYRVGDLVKRKGAVIQYLYDFGDSWAHELILEDSNFKGLDLPMPVFCLEGQRACPPEDVGGAGGFEEFLIAMEDPFHKAHNSFKEWYGGNFESEQFDPDEANWEILKYLRWSRDRLLPWDPD